ncbi:hypothetical protein PQX77_021864 [Marasmius sp. AFHP31]|nr:hypothetical protein PQX77_022127 [Marasmius sp. AFHP31]KAK1215533.1 hypothetical protein PQX77_021864 [Marasmius sp. AFHP31]
MFKIPVPQLRYWGAQPRTEFEVLRRHYKKEAQRNRDETMQPGFHSIAEPANPTIPTSSTQFPAVNQIFNPENSPPRANARPRSYSLSVHASPSKSRGGPAKKKIALVDGNGKKIVETTILGDESYKDSSGTQGDGSNSMAGVEPRLLKNLPRVPIKKPFELPDLATAQPEPSQARLLPSRTPTKPQKRPITSNEKYIEPMPGPFRVLRVSPAWLMQNVDNEDVATIVKNSQNFLPVIFFGAGARLFTEITTFTNAALEWMKGLGLGSSLILQPASAKSRTESRSNPFQPPIICLLSGFEPELKKYLTRHQTFVISPALAFHVLSFDERAVSWTITRLQGPLVTEEETDKQRARTAMISHLFKDPDYRRFTIEQAKSQRGTISDDEIVYRSLASFELHYVPEKDPQGNLSPYYLVTATPQYYHTLPQLHDEWIKIIEGCAKFSCNKSLAKYTVWKKKFKMCNLCKFDDCFEDECHITKMEGYDGPRLTAQQQDTAETDELPAAFAALVPNTTNHSSYRGWGGDRDVRGRGSRGFTPGYRGSGPNHRGRGQDPKPASTLNALTNTYDTQPKK